MGPSDILLDLAHLDTGLEKKNLLMAGKLGVEVGAEPQGRIMMLRKGNGNGRVIVVGGTITLDATSRWIEGGIDVGFSRVILQENSNLVANDMAFVAQTMLQISNKRCHHQPLSM
jgi:hypothetical protein